MAGYSDRGKTVPDNNKVQIGRAGQGLVKAGRLHPQ